MNEKKKVLIGGFINIRSNFILPELLEYMNDNYPQNQTDTREVSQLLRSFPLEREIVRSKKGTYSVYKRIL